MQGHLLLGRVQQLHGNVLVQVVHVRDDQTLVHHGLGEERVPESGQGDTIGDASADFIAGTIVLGRIPKQGAKVLLLLAEDRVQFVDIGRVLVLVAGEGRVYGGLQVLERGP